MITNQTILHPTALLALLLASILIVVLPRRYVLFPFLIAAVFIPVQQRLVLQGIDFYTLRILLMFGWLRIAYRQEYRHFQANHIDLAIILWQLLAFISYNLLWQHVHTFTASLGVAVDAICLYIMIRIWIIDLIDIKMLAAGLSIIIVVMGGFICVEVITGRNIFHILGNFSEFSWVRDGSIRVQGPFRHPNTLGIFFASALPLFFTLFSKNRYFNVIVLLSIVSVGFIVYNTTSSASVGALISVILLLSMWPLRHYRRQLFYAMVSALAALQVYWMIFKDKHIWALILKGRIFSASTAYHRYYLFDQFVNHFREWWLLGTPSSAHWGPRYSFTWDQSNQFVFIGAQSGIFPLIAFITVLIFCFLVVDMNLELFRSNNRLAFINWCLGLSLVAHLGAFWAVPYYDQVIVSLFVTFALIAAASDMNAQITRSLFARLKTSV